MSRRQSQLSFSGRGLSKPSDQFGGSLLKGNPKSKRPLDSKLPIHLVLRARKSQMRLPSTFAGVNRILTQTAAKHGLTIYKFANVGNHLHLILKVPNRRQWQRFIREITGRIASLIREKLKSKDGAFWQHRPFTRIIRGWKKAFQLALDYLQLNQLEADGHIRRSQIRSLSQLRQLFSDA